MWLVLKTPISIVIISAESFPLFGDTVKYFPTPIKKKKKKNKVK